tara:strand:+ start:1279 stop:2016 length:738 start_codon:yes stop_codon:yes gene_type:complete
MKEIIAIHGWGGDSKQWSNWIDYFQCCDWKWQSVERGYKDIRPYSPGWYNDLKQIGLKRVAICHSLGSHLIEKEVLSLATHVVLINSFSRFIPNSKENRSIKIALKKMMHAINTPNEPSMLQKFHIKAHKPNKINVKSNASNLTRISESGKLILKNDLKLLMHSNSLPSGLNTYTKVLVVNSKNDYIVANQTKEKLAQDLKKYLEKEPTIINLQDEGHTISKIKNIKKIKHWLELDHDKNMVQPS